MTRALPHRDESDGVAFNPLIVHTPSATFLGTRQWTHNGRSYTVRTWLYQGRVLCEIPLDLIYRDEEEEELKRGFQALKALMEAEPHRGSSSAA